MPAPSFGLFLNAGAQLGADHQAVFDLVLTQARLAEDLGYHDVWVTEHHFIPFGVNSNALTLAGFLLGHTHSLRVGTAVTLAPQYHPLQLAGQAAILDQCSGGRLDFGIGRGGYLKEFEAFGTDPARWDDEIETTASILMDAWTKPEVSSESRWAAFAPVAVNPRPLTRPHPPLFAATSTPASVAFAARNGIPLLHYWASPLDARLKLERAYDAERPAAKPHVHALIVIVADDEESTRAKLALRLKESFKAGDWPHVPQAANRHVGPDGKPVPRDTLAEFVAAQAIVGPPQRVFEALQEARARLGARRFVLFMEPIAERATILASVERFAREVMPRFADCRQTMPQLTA